IEGNLRVRAGFEDGVSDGEARGRSADGCTQRAPGEFFGAAGAGGYVSSEGRIAKGAENAPLKLGRSGEARGEPRRRSARPPQGSGDERSQSGRFVQIGRARFDAEARMAAEGSREGQGVCANLQMGLAEDGDIAGGVVAKIKHTVEGNFAFAKVRRGGAGKRNADMQIGIRGARPGRLEAGGGCSHQAHASGGAGGHGAPEGFERNVAQGGGDAIPRVRNIGDGGAGADFAVEDAGAQVLHGKRSAGELVGSAEGSELRGELPCIDGEAGTGEAALQAKAIEGRGATVRAICKVAGRCDRALRQRWGV